MSVRDDLRREVTVANASAPAIQTAFEVVVKHMGEAAKNSQRSCPFPPLRGTLNVNQREAVIAKLRAEDIEVVEHAGMGPTEQSWTELKW